MEEKGEAAGNRWWLLEDGVEQALLEFGCGSLDYVRQPRRVEVDI